MNYVVATDVGGTCTDTVIIADGKTIHIGKALSTPPDFAHGVIDSIQSAADAMQVSISDVLSNTSLFIHGSTVVDNTILERKGAITGLITTRGFEDTLLVTRGAYGRWSGLSEEGLKHPVATNRPEPLVSFERILGVDERVDYKGAVINALDTVQVKDDVAQLISNKDLQSIAICLLWSFNNNVHEEQLAELIREQFPDVFVSLSSDIAPHPGEYERTSTTVINAYAGQVVHNYITDLQEQLKKNSYDGEFLVMQGYGGLIPAGEAAQRAVNMVECGPVAGVIGSKYLSNIMGDEDVIAADMGGTTFKVGVIQKGEFEYAREPLIDRFHYSVPKIDVASIGSGGGSLVSLEPGTLVPQVGPQSAGANPGPICYDRGGEEPTLTDVLLIVGYIDPDHFLNDSMQLNKAKTLEIFAEKIAKPLDLSVEDAAIGIYKVASAQITDLIHKITVEQGLDPRDFVLHSFGGTCPMLASTFGRELNVKRIVIPYSASVNCAFGLATADVVHEYSVVETLEANTDVQRINDLFAPMQEQAKNDLTAEGFSDDKIQYRWSIALRYAMQVHEIITPVNSAIPMDTAGLETLINDFEQLYESRYGKGSAYRDAGIELTQFRLTATGAIERPELKPEKTGNADASAAKVTNRKVLVESLGKLADADIYDFNLLEPGHEITGPAVIHTPITTIVIQDRQVGKMDGFRNIIIEKLTS